MRKKAKTIKGIFEKDTMNNPPHDVSFKIAMNRYRRREFGDKETHPFLVRLVLESVDHNLQRGRFSNKRA